LAFNYTLAFIYREPCVIRDLAGGAGRWRERDLFLAGAARQKQECDRASLRYIATPAPPPASTPASFPARPAMSDDGARELPAKEGNLFKQVVKGAQPKPLRRPKTLNPGTTRTLNRL